MNKIKEFREKNKISQEHMSMILDNSIDLYIQKENGLVAFDVEDIKIFKAYFNLSIEEAWKLFFE